MMQWWQWLLIFIFTNHDVSPDECCKTNQSYLTKAFWMRRTIQRYRKDEVQEQHWEIFFFFVLFSKFCTENSSYTATLIILNFLIQNPTAPLLEPSSCKHNSAKTTQKLNFQHPVTHKLTQTQLCFISYIYHTSTHGKYPLQKHASVKIILSVGGKSTQKLHWDQK